MASPRCLFRPVREIAFRARPQVSRRKLCPITQTRFASDDQKISDVPAGTKGPNEDQLPHVSEEQAAMDKSMGNTPPDIDQGTPVKEVSDIREAACGNILTQSLVLQGRQRSPQERTSSHQGPSEVARWSWPEEIIFDIGATNGRSYRSSARAGHTERHDRGNGISRCWPRPQVPTSRCQRLTEIESLEEKIRPGPRSIDQVIDATWKTKRCAKGRFIDI